MSVSSLENLRLPRSKPHLEPLSHKRNHLLSLTNFKSLPKIQDFFPLSPEKPYENPTVEQLFLESFPKDFLRKIPKECLFNPSKSLNPLVFLDLLTMNKQEISEEIGFFYNFSSRASCTTACSENFHDKITDKSPILTNSPLNRMKFLILIQIKAENLNKLRISLDSLYENIAFFRNIGLSEQDFAIIVLFNGIVNISEEIAEEFFRKSEEKLQIPFIYTFEARKMAYLADLENFLKKKDYKMPLDSCYIHEMDYSPEKSQNTLKIKVLLAVKLKEISQKELILWYIRGFCEFFQPEFCAVLKCGAFLKGKSLWNSYISFENDRKLGGIYGFQANFPDTPFDLSKKLEIPKEKPNFMKKLLDKIGNLKDFCVFQEILEQTGENWLDFQEERAFGLFRWEILRNNNEKDRFFDGINDNMEFNRIFGLEASCNSLVKVQENVEISNDFTENFAELMKKKKRVFTENWLFFSNFLRLYLKRVFFSKNLSFSNKISFIFEVFHHFFLTLCTYFSISLVFSLIFIVTNLFLRDFSNKSFELLNVQMISLVYFLLFICSLFHLSFFFKPEENQRNFRIISVFFAIIYYSFLLILLWKIGDILEKRWKFLLFSGILGYYLFPVIFYWKLGKILIKTSFSYFFQQYLGIFFDIYALTSFREDFSKENPIYFEKMLVNNVLLTLFVMIVNSNEEYSLLFVKGVLSFYAIFHGFHVLSKIMGKIQREIKGYLLKKRRKNSVFQGNPTEIIVTS